MLKKKNNGQGNFKHRYYGTPTYTSWVEMIRRCENPHPKDIKYYQRDGICVCKRWRKSFQSFLDDMGERPEGHTIDRINNDKGYSPENCRWATKKQQVQNRRLYKNKEDGL
jgi:hypothetical protein